MCLFLYLWLFYVLKEFVVVHETQENIVPFHVTSPLAMFHIMLFESDCSQKLFKIQKLFILLGL
jgi:hypothetical protein